MLLMERRQEQRQPVQRNQEAQDLIESHYGLVKSIAHNIQKRLPPQAEFWDLVGYGSIGLCRAADRFDPERGVVFSTYATPKITGAILDGLRELDPLPRTRRQKLKEYETAKAIVEAKEGREATQQEMMDALSITESQYNDILIYQNGDALASLDANYCEEGGAGELSNILSDNDAGNPIHFIEEQEDEELRLVLCESLLSRLSERERLVIHLYYYKKLPFRLIGQQFGVSESRVSQIRTRSINKLKDMVKGDE